MSGSTRRVGETILQVDSLRVEVRTDRGKGPVLVDTLNGR